MKKCKRCNGLGFKLRSTSSSGLSWKVTTEKEICKACHGKGQGKGMK